LVIVSDESFCHFCLRLIGENTKFIEPIMTESGLRIYPVLGNHDAFPKSHFSPNPVENDLYSKVGDLWCQCHETLFVP
jgi:hypothetical protein